MRRLDLIAESYHGTTTNYGYGCRCDECRAAAAANQRRKVNARRGLPPGDPRHGTLNGYRNWRCACEPCEPCRVANAADVTARNAKRRGSIAPGDPRHGTVNAYGNYGCRCPLCRAAGTAKRRRYRAES